MSRIRSILTQIEPILMQDNLLILVQRHQNFRDIKKCRHRCYFFRRPIFLFLVQDQYAWCKPIFLFLVQANILVLGARTIFSVQDQYSWCKTNIFIAGQYSCSWCKATWWTSCTGRTVAECATRLGIGKMLFWKFENLRYF